MDVNSNFTIKYPDYKKFINLIKNEYKITLSNISPLNYFHPNNANKLLDPSNFFKEKPIEMPDFRINKRDFNNFNRFEKFTSKNEVKNISLWALSCLNFLSGKNARLGKELEIIQSKNPRDGRLDVVICDKEEILILESKTTLFNLLSEKRFKIQIPEYYKECKKITEDNFNVSIFLLVGGEESDLYPPTNSYCVTGQVGNMAKIFYDAIIKYKIKFISANALWGLYAKSILSKKKLFWKDILPKIFSDDNTLGILSGGKVIINKNEIRVVRLDI